MTPESILIVKTSSLGDIICALPVLSELHRLYEAAHIAWVVDHRFADLLVGHPYLQAVYRFTRHKPRISRDAFLKARAFLREISGVTDAIRERRWDVALDLQSAFKSSLILRDSGAHLRIAEFAGPRHISSLFAANRLVIPHRQHAVDRALEMAHPLGVSLDNPRFCLWMPDEARAWAAGRLADLPLPRLVVNPGSARPEKRWPPQHFAEAARALLDNGVVGSLIITGATSDRHAAAVIAEAAEQNPERALDLTGETTLHQLAAVLDASTTMLTGDTGPMHMMAALGKPVVVIFGPSNAGCNGPYGEGHIVLRARDRRVASVSPEQAATAVAEILHRQTC